MTPATLRAGAELTPGAAVPPDPRGGAGKRRGHELAPAGRTLRFAQRARGHRLTPAQLRKGAHQGGAPAHNAASSAAVPLAT